MQVKLILSGQILTTDIDAPNGKNWTPLDCAAACGAEDICDLLLGEEHLTTKEHQKITPLHLACMGGHANTVRLLLSNNQDCTQLDADGRNCLDYDTGLSKTERP